MAIKLRNGIFLAPFHPVDEDPTLCIQRDLELIDHLDRLGYDEAWIGEHHSAGFEIIASPDYAHTILFITFDEGTTNIGLQGDTGGHVFTAAVAPWLSHVASNLFFDHYSLLRTVEDTFGLPCLASACQRSAMTPFLR